MKSGKYYSEASPVQACAFGSAGAELMPSLARVVNVLARTRSVCVYLCLSKIFCVHAFRMSSQPKASGSGSSTRPKKSKSKSKASVKSTAFLDTSADVVIEDE